MAGAERDYIRDKTLEGQETARYAGCGRARSDVSPGEGTRQKPWNGGVAGAGPSVVVPGAARWPRPVR